MAIITPIHLNKWLPNSTILSAQAKAEFMNIYNLLNGNIDSANIKDSSITNNKLAPQSISGDKLQTIPASKITGRLSLDNLPVNMLTTVGGTLSGTITFDVQPGTALLKNYDDEEVVLYEGGTGTNKIKLVVGGTNVLRIFKGDTLLWALQSDGLEIPKALKIPVV